MAKSYVDSDGHIMENVQELIEFLEEPYKGSEMVMSAPLLPSLDKFHTPRIRKKGVFDRTVGPERWLEFLDKTGIEYTVLYPTNGLSYGQVVFPDWALAYARAYNNWLHEKYLKRSPRFKGIALIPMQDVPSAVNNTGQACKIATYKEIKSNAANR